MADLDYELWRLRTELGHAMDRCVPKTPEDKLNAAIIEAENAAVAEVDKLGSTEWLKAALEAACIDDTAEEAASDCAADGLEEWPLPEEIAGAYTQRAKEQLVRSCLAAAKKSAETAASQAVAFVKKALEEAAEGTDGPDKDEIRENVGEPMHKLVNEMVDAVAVMPPEVWSVLEQIMTCLAEATPLEAPAAFDLAFSGIVRPDSGEMQP